MSAFVLVDSTLKVPLMKCGDYIPPNT